MGRIVSREELTALLGRAQRGTRRVVFTNGCFDLLHPGHIRTLEEARSLGDVLVVGLNRDASVRKAKGDARPVIGEEERAELLAALEAVDFVVLFDEPTPRELIAELLPDVLVKGADWGSTRSSAAKRWRRPADAWSPYRSNRGIPPAEFWKRFASSHRNSLTRRLANAFPGRYRASRPSGTPSRAGRSVRGPAARLAHGGSGGIDGSSQGPGGGAGGDRVAHADFGFGGR